MIYTEEQKKELTCKPCPWCGSVPDVTQPYSPNRDAHFSANWGTFRDWIECPNCHAQGPHAFSCMENANEMYHVDAVKAWNEREFIGGDK